MLKKTNIKGNKTKMKKILVMVAAAALCGASFATNIFDYKASVKYVDLKTTTVKNSNGNKVKALFKVVKSATLTGYLVTPVGCPCTYEDSEACRFGNLPGFLVLKNRAAQKNNGTVSTVKLMPANLLASWWTTKELGTNKVTLEAQGYLFAGVGKRDVPDPVGSPFYGLGDHDALGMTAGTKFLFGLYNDSDNGEFIEPFLDQAGFGKASYDPGDEGSSAGCFWEAGIDGSICLTSLSGHLIGGSFMCYPNAVYVTKNGLNSIWGAVSEGYLCQGWNYGTENFSSKDTAQGFPYSYASICLYNVVAGTWSIKANPKLEAKAVANGYVSERDYVEYVGKTLDKNFKFTTFDQYSSAKRAATDQTAGNFVAKWFDQAPVK